MSPRRGTLYTFEPRLIRRALRVLRVLHEETSAAGLPLRRLAHRLDVSDAGLRRYLECTDMQRLNVELLARLSAVAGVALVPKVIGRREA